MVDNRRTVTEGNQIHISNRVSWRSLVKLSVEGPKVGLVRYPQVGIAGPERN